MKDISRVEYYALIGIKPISQDQDEDRDSSTTGRKKSPKFQFSESHPLYHTHNQYIKSSSQH